MRRVPAFVSFVSFVGFVGFAAAALAGMCLAAPAAQGAVYVPVDDLTLSFAAPVRTVVDNGIPGTSVGDLTVSSGDVRSIRSGKRIGYYATNQVTVRADAATGREIRKVDLSIALREGTIFATSLIRAELGTPPSENQVFAITGGTGVYTGARGALVHGPVQGQPGFLVKVDFQQ